MIQSDIPQVAQVARLVRQDFAEACTTKIGVDIVAIADDTELDATLSATAPTPTCGSAKEFGAIMARQHAHIATIAQARSIHLAVLQVRIRRHKSALAFQREYRCL